MSLKDLLEGADLGAPLFPEEKPPSGAEQPEVADDVLPSEPQPSEPQLFDPEPSEPQRIEPAPAGPLNTAGEAVFGIDLGTTYSAIAWLDANGKPEVLANLDGQPTTPSVVCFESPENVIVGETAKEMIPQPECSGRVVSFIKREMGNGAYRFDTPDGKSYSPIEISGFILRKLAQDAEAKCGMPVRKVVITCPAYFGTDEHRATKEAGKWAGLDVLGIVNEPTAAAFAYGVKEDEPQTILVYDLGGGTFDATAIRVKADGIEVVATGGDSTLGGKDWDKAFSELLASKWREASGEEKDVLADENYAKELMGIAEKNKKFLSTRSTVKIRVAPPDAAGRQVEVSREEFDAATAGLLESTITATKDVLAKAALKEGVASFEFDTLLCVGGSSLMPQVAERLRREFGKTPKIDDPHESVAKGAAIYAGLHMKGLVGRDGQARGEIAEGDVSGGRTEGNGQPQIVEDILSRSYGLVASRRAPGGGMEDVVYNLLLCNQPARSAAHTHIFKTQVDGQRSIKFRVAESGFGCWENAKADNPASGAKDAQNRIFAMDPELVKILQTADMDLPPGLAAGERVEVTYSVDGDMILNLTAVLLKTGDRIAVRCEGVGVKVPDAPMPDGITVE